MLGEDIVAQLVLLALEHLEEALPIESLLAVHIRASDIDLLRINPRRCQKCRRHIHVLHQCLALRARFHLARPAHQGGDADAVVIQAPLATVRKGTPLLTDEHHQRIFFLLGLL